MRTMADLVNDVLSLNNKDLELLAEAIALYDVKKASILEFLLNANIKETT